MRPLASLLQFAMSAPPNDALQRRAERQRFVFAVGFVAFALLAMPGCASDVIVNVGATPGDASGPASFPPEDLAALPEDLLPDRAPCPPSCDAGQCSHACRGDGGAMSDYITTSLEIRRIQVGAEWPVVLSACIVNQGQAIAGPVPVSFRWNQGEGASVIGVVYTDGLLPGSGRRVDFVWFNPSNAEGSCPAWAVVNDTGVAAAHISPIVAECDTVNNESPQVDSHLCGPM